MYAYVRNNPMVHVDPDGQELHLVIYNSSGIDKQLMTRVAIGIASKYKAAGVKNVSYEIRQGKPSDLTQAAAELLPTPHSHFSKSGKTRKEALRYQTVKVGIIGNSVGTPLLILGSQ